MKKNVEFPDDGVAEFTGMCAKKPSNKVQPPRGWFNRMLCRLFEIDCGKPVMPLSKKQIAALCRKERMRYYIALNRPLNTLFR